MTSLTDKRIRDVSTSDAAIVVMLQSGDVIALNDFSTRRIMSTKQFDVVKMVATGGHLDSRVVPNTDLVSFSFFTVVLARAAWHDRVYSRLSIR